MAPPNAIAVEIGIKAAVHESVFTAEAFVRQLDSLVPAAFSVYRQLLPGDNAAVLGKEDMRRFSVAKDVIDKRIKLMTGPEEMKELISTLTESSNLVSQAAINLLQGIDANPATRRAALELLDQLDPTKSG